MKKILIVDDEEDVRDFFKEILSNAGYTCELAVDGSDCLFKLSNGTYDLVLMDMFMPVMSGREVFEKIIHDRSLKNNKVAFLTVADLDVDGKEELKNRGVLDYIIKPIEADKLVARVKKLLGG